MLLESLEVKNLMSNKSLIRNVKNPFTGLSLTKRREMNKKGQVLDLLTSTIIGLLVFLAVVLGVLLAMGSLGRAIILPGQANFAVNATIDNTSQGITSFVQNIPTAFVVFGVVFILSVVGILIAVVLRFRNAGGGGGL